MLDAIRQKAGRTWTVFYQSVYSVFFCIGIYAISIWSIWRGLHQANNIIVYLSVLWMLFISWLSTGHFDVEDEDSDEEDDEEDYTNKKNYYTINVKGFSKFVFFFSGIVMVSDIRILIFPIAISIPLVIQHFHWSGENNSYMDNLFIDSFIIQRIWSNGKHEKYNNERSWLCYVLFSIVASYICIFISACFFNSTNEGFIKLVLMGAHVIASLVVVFVWMIYRDERDTRPLRIALGVDISQDAIKILERIYPKGVNTDRIQFLLHDTLKEEIPTHPEIDNLSIIRSLLLLFPGVLDIADDEGNVPFPLACQFSSVEVVKHMAEIDNDLLNIRDSNGNTVMHYACLGNNYKVINYLLTRHMKLVTKRNIDSDLPVYVLSSCTHHLIHGKVNGVPVRSNYGRSELDNPQHLETIWKLLLTNPADMQEKKLPSTQCTAVTEGGDLSVTSLKPQKHHKLLVYVILVLVNMTAAVYIGTLQSFSNTNHQKNRSEVKRLVDELVASQNEMNLLRSRMETLKYLQMPWAVNPGDASGQRRRESISANQ